MGDQFAVLAAGQPTRQRTDEQRHRVQRLPQVVAGGGEEARFGAVGFNRLVARGLQLGLERALAADVEQHDEGALNAPGRVLVGIGEAAHDVDRAAREMGGKLELGVLAGERALEPGFGVLGKIAGDLADLLVEVSRRPRARPGFDGLVDEMADEIDVEIRDHARQAVRHDIEHLRVAQKPRRALEPHAVEREGRVGRKSGHSVDRLALGRVRYR